MKVIRYMIADYLRVNAMSETGTAEFSLMGAGVTSLDENPSAKITTEAFVSDKSASGTITGYENKFPFDTQFITDEAAIAFIYDIARNQKSGSDAETEYVRVDIFAGEDGATSYPARKFRVAVEVSGITGAGTEIVRVAGTLHQVGNFVEGTFNTQTNTFSAAE